MQIEDMNNIHTLDDYIKFFLIYLRSASGHYKRERGKYDFVFNEKKEKPTEEAKTYRFNSNSKSKNTYSSKFKSKGKERDQSVNALLENYERDNNSTFMEEDDSESGSNSKSDSDEDNNDYLNGEGSSDEENNILDNAKTEDKDNQLNSFTSTTPQKPPTNILVCYEMVNKGSCKREKCEFSHDKDLIEKYKQQRSEYRKKNPTDRNRTPTTPKSILRRS